MTAAGPAVNAVPPRPFRIFHGEDAVLPLLSPADWRRFVGRRATVTSGVLAGGKQEIEILALEGEEGAEVAVVRDPKGRDYQVPLSAITQARLAFHWKQ